MHLEPSHNRSNLADAGEEPAFRPHGAENRVGKIHTEHQRQTDFQLALPKAVLHQPALLLMMTHDHCGTANPVLPERRSFVVAWEKKDSREWWKSDSQFWGRAFIRYVHCSYHGREYSQVQKPLPYTLSGDKSG